MTFAEWMYCPSALSHFPEDEAHLHTPEQLIEEELDMRVGCRSGMHHMEKTKETYLPWAKGDRVSITST